MKKISRSGIRQFIGWMANLLVRVWYHFSIRVYNSHCLVLLCPVQMSICSCLSSLWHSFGLMQYQVSNFSGILSPNSVCDIYLTFRVVVQQRPNSDLVALPQCWHLISSSLPSFSGTSSSIGSLLNLLDFLGSMIWNCGDGFCTMRLTDVEWCVWPIYQTHRERSE